MWMKSVLLAIALTIAVSVSARAQTLPATPLAAACTAAPVSINELRSIVAASPIAATPAPAARLDDAAKNAIIAAVDGSIACTNANQPLRALSFFTTRYLAARFSGAGADDLGHLTVAVTRSPSPAAAEDRLALVSVDQFAMLSDGRVSARVTTANRDQTFVDRLIFAKTDGKWLIDEVASEAPAPATPVA
jgi:hypothetical protein